MTRAVAAAFDVESLLADPDTHIIVCCGSGGVGKTTTSAALAVHAADQGRRVVVLTIDPARRLAQSMGLSALDNEPRLIDGVGAHGGSLHAMTLDMKRTFDEIVEAHADPDRAQQIFDNPFYVAMSTSFAGTQEYMAMEKLAQLSQRAATTGEWDLIVVDTPPSRSALDFLDAPERLGSFLDGPLVRILAAPARHSGKAGLRLFGAGLGLVSSVLDKILGAQLVGDVQTFVASLDAMFGSFRERAQSTYQLLQSAGTAFVVVASPEPDALREATFFVERLRTDHMPLAGVVVNRMHPAQAQWLGEERAIAASLRLRDTDDLLDQLTHELLLLHVDLVARSSREHRLTEAFTRAHPRVPVALVPSLDTDVHDLVALRQVAQLLLDDVQANEDRTGP